MFLELKFRFDCGLKLPGFSAECILDKCLSTLSKLVMDSWQIWHEKVVSSLWADFICWSKCHCLEKTKRQTLQILSGIFCWCFEVNGASVSSVTCWQRAVVNISAERWYCCLWWSQVVYNLTQLFSRIGMRTLVVKQIRFVPS